MNELRSHTNEGDHEDSMTKKYSKVTTYISKVDLPLKYLNHRNFIVKRVLFGAIYVR